MDDEEEITSVAKTITILKRLTDKKTNLTPHQFDKIHKFLKGHNNGFSEEELLELIKILTKTPRLNVFRFKAIIRCLVPRSQVSMSVIDHILCWIFSNKETLAVNKISETLQWIIALLEYNFIDRDILDGYYYMFFNFLKNKFLQSPACKLIYVLTRPRDVRRSLVKTILKYNSKSGCKHWIALLSLFKSYRPEIVPEEIQVIGQEFAFRKLSEDICNKLELAQHRRNMAEQVDVTQHTPRWDGSAISVKKGRKQRKIIPEVVYANLECAWYSKTINKTIYEFTDMVKLVEELPMLDTPNNSLSLLSNLYGHHVLIFGEETLQNRVSGNIYHTLYKIFVIEGDSNINYSYVIKKDFLQNIAILEDMMLQGIPVLTKFIFEYLPYWDGEDFREEIFSLISWVCVPFSVLSDYILIHIYTLFLSSEVIVKCDIIAMLLRLLGNLYLMKQRHEKDVRNPFLLGNIDTPCDSSLKELTAFTKNLIKVGVLLEKNNPLLLNEALNFFEAVYMYESSNLPSIITIMPRSVVYRILFSHSPVCIDRLCNLMLKYLSGQENSLQSKIITESVKTNIIDIINLLFNKQVCNNQGIFETFDYGRLKSLKKIVKHFKSAFDITTHVAFSPYISKFFTETECESLRIVDCDVLLKDCLPNVYELSKVPICEKK